MEILFDKKGGESIRADRELCVSCIQPAPFSLAIKLHAAFSTLIYNGHQSALPKLEKLSLTDDIK